MGSLPVRFPASEERIFMLDLAHGSKETLVDNSDWASSYDSTTINQFDDDEFFTGKDVQVSFHKETVMKKDGRMKSLLTMALAGKNNVPTGEIEAAPLIKTPAKKIVAKPRKVRFSEDLPRPDNGSEGGKEAVPSPNEIASRPRNFQSSRESAKPDDSKKCYEHSNLQPLGFVDDKTCIYEKTPRCLGLSKVHHSRCLCDKRFVAPCATRLRENKSWYDLIEQFGGTTF